MKYRKTIFTLFSILTLSFFAGIANATINNNLRYGSKGAEVTELQNFLIKKGFLNSEPTGNFFSMTLRAVVDYQKSVGLPSTGFVGSMTRGKISEEASSLGSTTGVINQPLVTDPNDKFDYSTYTSLSVYGYVASSSKYMNKGVNVTNAVINRFLQAGFDGGNSNYIEISESSTSSLKIMLKIDDDSNYKRIAADLRSSDKVNVFGIATSSEMIDSYKPQDSSTTTKLVILVQRIDLCDRANGSCLSNNIKIIFSNFNIKYNPERSFSYAHSGLGGNPEVFKNIKVSVSIPQNYSTTSIAYKASPWNRLIYVNATVENRSNHYVDYGYNNFILFDKTDGTERYTVTPISGVANIVPGGGLLYPNNFAKGYMVFEVPSTRKNTDFIVRYKDYINGKTVNVDFR